jgi:hypothetical protein
MNGRPAHSTGLSILRVGMVLGCTCSWFGPIIGSAEAPRTPMVDEQHQTAESASTDIEPGELYRSRTRIAMAPGVSFLIPPAWQGVLPPGSRTFYLESSKKPGIGLVVMIQDATPEELEDHLNEPQVLEEGYVLHPVGSAQRTDARITASYHSGENIGRALGLFGPSNQELLFFFTGPTDETAYYEALLEEIAASTKFSITEQNPLAGREGT